MELDRLLVLNTLRENWLLSFSSPPPGASGANAQRANESARCVKRKITEGAAGCEKPFFNTLLGFPRHHLRSGQHR
jgi:hypothetical protein